MSGISDLLLLVNGDMNKTLDTLITEKETAIQASVSSIPVEVNMMPMPSDAVKVSNDAERYVMNTNSVWRCPKSILFLQKPGVIRVSYELKWGNSSITFEIRINGVAVGVARTISSGDSYVSYSEDFAVNTGDSIELWGKVNSSSGYAYVRNFRLKWTMSTPQNGVAILDVGYTS